MNTNNFFVIKANEQLTADVYRMTLVGDTSKIVRPGQFVNIALEGFSLRRPISVCDWDENKFTVIYKVVGEGTEQMSKLPVGFSLDVLTGLGNGFDVSLSGEQPLVIGGGVGVPPMYALTKKLIQAGKNPHVILGFNKKEEIFLLDEFQSLTSCVTVTTVDGSFGTKGFVTDAFTCDYTFFYACGPMPMLKAVYDKSVTSGQLSFEERMGCGFGACMGCTHNTKSGPKRVCKEGVLIKEDVIW